MAKLTFDLILVQEFSFNNADMNLIANLFYTYPFISVSLVLSTIWKLWPLLQSRRSIWTGKELNWIEKVIFCGVADFAKVWHGYEIHGLDELVKNKSNCLLIGYHSRPTLDIIYLTCTIQCHVLVTHLLFYIPILGSLLPLLGIIPSKGGVKDDAETTFIEALSKGDRPMMLLPGGTVECMKAYHDRYRVLWKENPGFARVVHAVPSLRANTKVVPFYTKNCERSMWTNAWWYTQSGRGVRFLMERFSKGGLASLPLMMITLLCSLGFFPLPAPVRMATYFGPQLTIKEDESPQEFAKRVKIELHVSVFCIMCTIMNLIFLFNIRSLLIV